MKLYVKSKGKFIPAPEWWRNDAMQEGYYLVGVHKGSRSYKRLAKKITPDIAKIEAALHIYEEAILETLQEAMVPTPKGYRERMTKGQIDTWNMIRKHFRTDLMYHRSISEISQMAADRLRKEMGKE